MDTFGDIEEGIYPKTLAIYPMDSQYEPYTNIVVPNDYKANLMIKLSGNIDELKVDNLYLDAPYNIYTKQPVQLMITENTAFGEHTGKLCIYSLPKDEGIIIGIGICINVKYNVIPKLDNLDFNNDNIINNLDLIPLRNNLNSNNLRYDINKDNKINILDLILLRNNLGRTSYK